jgi:hypothetical protein
MAKASDVDCCETSKRNPMQRAVAGVTVHDIIKLIGREPFSLGRTSEIWAVSINAWMSRGAQIGMTSCKLQAAS